MQFSTKEDIEAPIDQVFGIVTEFDAYERAALRRGVDVRRRSDAGVVGIGMTWDATFSMRGSPRQVELVIAELDAPNHIGIDANSQGIAARVDVDLIALSRGRTRMSVQLSLKPKTLSARLLLQSLRLARSSLNRRFKTRTSNFARSVEDRIGRGNYA